MKTSRKRIIYTSLDGLKIAEAEVRSMFCLSEKSVDWITETAINLLEKRTPSELKAKEGLLSLFPDTQEQVYFRIKGSSFFLDFFIPERNVAVEIDGSSHRHRKSEDKERDLLFGEIGIKTIRISASRVMNGYLEEDFFEGLKKSKNRRRAKRTKKKRSKWGNR